MPLKNNILTCDKCQKETGETINGLCASCRDSLPSYIFCLGAIFGSLVTIASSLIINMMWGIK